MGLTSSLAQQLPWTDKESEVDGELKVTCALISQVCNFAPYLLLPSKHSKLTFLLSLL